jgi:importin subunit alpha-1
MMVFLRRASAGGPGRWQRGMVKEALFVLSNVAGSNNATVKALLDAGARDTCGCLVVLR